MKKRIALVLPVLLFFACMFPTHAAWAQSKLVGKWKTIDDETNRAKSIVEIYMVGDKLHGKVVELFRLPEEDQDPKCDKCDKDDSRYNKRVLGMEILTGLEKDSDTEYEDGKILDPKNGKVYDCDIELESADKLKVRGYIGISLLGRTQYWHRVK